VSATTEDAPRPDVFRIEYGCENCGESWSDTYPPETDVTEYKSEVTINDKATFDGTRREICPNCELTGDVTVDGREPLGEDDES
jgi:hypothetical protein